MPGGTMHTSFAAAYSSVYSAPLDPVPLSDAAGAEYTMEEPTMHAPGPSIAYDPHSLSAATQQLLIQQYHTLQQWREYTMSLAG